MSNDIVTTAADFVENGSATTDIQMPIPDIDGTREMTDGDHDHEQLPAITATADESGAEAAHTTSASECDPVVEEGRASSHELEEGERDDINDDDDHMFIPAIEDTASLKLAAETDAPDESTMPPKKQQPESFPESDPKAQPESVELREQAVLQSVCAPKSDHEVEDICHVDSPVIENNPSELGKSTTSTEASLKLAAEKDAPKQPTTQLYHRPTATTKSGPKTPKELYKQIENSRDKLFFIAYAEPPDPIKKWFLVRVDLPTSCQELETGNCMDTGKYYVEYYTKASYDLGILLGILLAGNPLEDGIPAAKMKPKPDSESRYWLEWHEFHYDKNNDMVLGKYKEFNPNSAKEIRRRLMDLSLKRADRGLSPLDQSAIDFDEVEQHMYDKYTIWARELDLMNTDIRLVGPFDFEDIKPPPLTEEDLAPFDDEMKIFFMANHSSLFVKDRVPLSRWQELLEVLNGRDICPPTVVARASEEETLNKKAHTSSEKRTRIQEPAASVQDSSVKKRRGNPSGSVCHVCQTIDEGKGKLLSFPATSVHASLHVHVSCAKQSESNMIVSKDVAKRDISSLLESTLSQTRRAPSGNGRAYYMINELQVAMNEAIQKWVREFNSSASSRRGKQPQSVKEAEPARVRSITVIKPAAPSEPLQAPHAAEPQSSTSIEPLQGLSTADFTKEEIDSFPVAYAYYADGPDTGVSEENAKIATLNHESNQRQLRRSNGQAHQSTSTPTQTPTQPKVASHKNESSGTFLRRGVPNSAEMLSKHSPEAAADFPDGWLMIKKKRSGTESRVDCYWYSPKNRYMFRSRPEVHRFLKALEKSGGDETIALESIGIGKRQK
ncbi:hypothetical protein ACHAXH_001073 [Discostella pseudostelligera]